MPPFSLPTLLLAAFWLSAFISSTRADEFSADEHQRQTIYHSPQKPGFTSWVGVWTMPDGGLMFRFAQLPGPVGDDPCGKVDQSIVMDSFRLVAADIAIANR